MKINMRRDGTNTVIFIAFILINISLFLQVIVNEITFLEQIKQAFFVLLIYNGLNKIK